MSQLALENLTFSYLESGKVKTLEGVTFTADSSDITVLTGPSGCGKSTLLYLAAGIYPQNGGHILAGSIRAGDKDPSALEPNERCRLVGMMFQNPDLQFCMDTVEREIAFCLENIRMEPSEIRRMLEEALDFTGIRHLRSRTLATLSGGEKQKAMLACLVALRPQWLLLDEPFANIDDTSAKEIAAKLLAIHETFGTGILAVDHRLENWADTADIVRIMEKNGEIRPERYRLRELSPSQLAQWGICSAGQRYQDFKPVKSPSSENTLELKEICVEYGGRRILKQASASFCRGRIYGIIGDSGAGKTSLFGAISGICPYTGQILFHGQDLRKTRKKWAGKIGFVTQNPQDQFVADSVLEEVSVGLKNPREQAEKILKEIRLWRYRNLSPYMLSQGQQRRLGTAALLAYDCEVLICDEPTYAQDREHTLSIMGALQEAVLQKNIALVLSSHDRQLIRDYADVVYELKGGKLIEVDQSSL